MKQINSNKKYHDDRGNTVILTRKLEDIGKYQGEIVEINPKNIPLQHHGDMAILEPKDIHEARFTVKDLLSYKSGLVKILNGSEVETLDTWAIRAAFIDHENINEAACQEAVKRGLITEKDLTFKRVSAPSFKP